MTVLASRARLRRLPTWLAGVVAIMVAGTLVACNSSAKPAGVKQSGVGAPASASATLRLNYSWIGEYLGVAAAASSGLYEKNGVKVSIEQGKGSQLTANDVISGGSGFGIVDSGTSILTAAKGGDLVSVANVIGTSSFGFIVGKDTGITSVAGLKGKSIIVVPGTTQANFLPIVLKLNGLSESDVQIRSVDGSAQFSSFAAGQADALATSIATGAPVTDPKRASTKIYWSSIGFTVPDYSLVTTKKMLTDHPDQVRGVVQAVLSGWQEALHNPQPALDWIKKQSPTFDETSALAQWKLWTPLFCAAGLKGKPFGSHDPAQWTSSLSLVAQGSGVTSKKPVNDMYTNQFFEGSSPVTTSSC